MSIRVYFDPVKLASHSEFSKKDWQECAKRPEAWEGAGTINFLGLRVRWDFDSHGLPYVDLGNMLNGQACPEILERFSHMDLLAKAGYKFSTMRESWEGVSIPDQELKFSEREGVSVYVATAVVKREVQRTYLELCTSLPPETCLLFYRSIRKLDGARSRFHETSYLFQK